MKIDVVGEICPVPLIETRKALLRAESGTLIEIVGDHSSSKKEIPMAVRALGEELLEVREEGNLWHILIKKR